MPTYEIDAPDGKTYEIDGPAGASKDQIIAAIIAKNPQAGLPPSKERTFGEAAKDIAASGLSGIGSLVKAPGQLYGLATGNMEKTGSLGLGEDIEKYGEEMKSAGLKAREAERDRKIAEAEKKGQFAAFGTALGETIKDPGLLISFLAQQAPQLLIPFGAGRVGAGIAKGLGAAEAAAGAAGTASAIGAGAVQQGADVGAGAYEDIYKELRKTTSEKAAAEGAINLARAAGASGAIISLLSQKLPGAQAFEKYAAKVPGSGGRVAGAIKGGLGEAGQEITEETGGKFSQNLAMREVNPEQSLTAGLGQTAGMAALGGLGMGVLGGAGRPQTPQEQAPPEITSLTTAEQAPATEAPPEVPPQTTPEQKGNEIYPKGLSQLQSMVGGTNQVNQTFMDLVRQRKVQEEDKLAKEKEKIDKMADEATDPILKASLESASREKTKQLEEQKQKSEMELFLDLPPEEKTKLIEAGNLEAEASKRKPFESGVKRGWTPEELVGMGVESEVKENVEKAPPLDRSTNPNNIGIAGEPILEGGKLFASQDEAREARKKAKLADYVVTKMGEGWALSPKTKEDLERDKKKANILLNDVGVKAGDVIGAGQFIASRGGLHPIEKGDMGVEDSKNITHGKKKVFTFDGMGIDEATRLLMEYGFISEDNHDKAREAIKANTKSIEGEETSAKKRLAESNEEGFLEEAGKGLYAEEAEEMGYPVYQNDEQEAKALMKGLQDQGIYTDFAEADAERESQNQPNDVYYKNLVPKLREMLKGETLQSKAGQNHYTTTAEQKKNAQELEGKNINQVGQWLVDNAPNKTAKYIANKVLNRIKAMQSRGIKINFMVHTGEKRTIKLANANGFTNFIFGKNNEESIITVGLNGPTTLDKQTNFPPGTDYTTIFHELLHVAIRPSTRFYGKNDPLINELRKLYNIVAKHHNDNVKNGTHEGISKRYHNGQNNAFLDPDELVSWGLTDKEMQEYLSKIKVGESNVFSQLVKWVRQALGIEPQYESALDRLIRTTDSILDETIEQVSENATLHGYSFGSLKAAKPTTELKQQSLFSQKIREIFNEDFASRRQGFYFDAKDSPLYKTRTAAEVKPVSEQKAEEAIMGNATGRRIAEKNITIPAGKLVGIRQDLNILRSSKGTTVLAVHEGKASTHGTGAGFFNGDVIKYLPVATLKNVYFKVQQGAREKIASGKESKSPMASADGEFVPTNNPNFDGIEIGFNPMQTHLFMDTLGRVIKYADEVTITGNKLFARGKIEYYGEEDVPAKAGEAATKGKLLQPTGVIPTIEAATEQVRAKPSGYQESLFSQRNLTDNLNFTKWFGDSKLADIDGNPMILYHGTTKDIKAFKMSPDGALGAGIYLTPSTEYAGQYAPTDTTGSNVMPVYASIKNPLVIDGSINDPMIEALVKLGVDKNKAEKIVEKAYDEKGYVGKQVMTRALAQGYDGLMQYRKGILSEIVAYSPTQVKSIFNQGRYGQYDKEILQAVNLNQNTNEEETFQAMNLNQAVGKVKGVINKAQQRKVLPEGAFKGMDPAILNAVQPIFYAPNKTIVDRIEGLKDNFFARLAQKTVDQFRSIRDVSPIGYMMARLSQSVDGALEGLLFYGKVINDDGALNIQKGTKGMYDILKPLGIEVDRFQIWMALNREQNLPAEKRSPNLDNLRKVKDDFNAGTMDNGQNRNDVYKKVKDELMELNRSVLDVAKSKGLIDAEAYTRFANDAFYIPFYREMEDGKVESIQSSSTLTNKHFSEALKGKSEKPFGDLMENTLRNWSHILSASMKNGAAVQTMKDAEREMFVSKVTPSHKGTDVVKVMEDGKQQLYRVHDPFLLESVSNITFLGKPNAFLDVAKDFRNILRFGVTISPAFKVSNLFKDSISSMAVSGLEKTPWSNVVGTWAETKRGSPAYIEALAGGGIFNFGTSLEGDQAALIKKLIARGVDPKTILSSPEGIKDGLKTLYKAYEDLGNRTEAVNRLALYKQLRAKGLNHLEASFQARDLLDFSMQGSSGAFRYLTQTVPFMNARLQGLYKLGRDGIIPTVRQFYRPDGKALTIEEKQKAQAFTLVSVSTMLASMALYLAFKDDDDFKKREQWDRDNFWWIKLPGMDSALRIPKPFEIGAFGTIAERVLEQIVDQEAEGKQFGDSMSNMLWNTFSMNPVPQWAKPLVDLYANKDSFTGAPIETAGMEKLSKAERMTDTTSPLAIALGGIMNTVLPESKELSPVQTDYMIKSYFGWLGGTAAAASHYAVMPFKEGAYPDANWQDRVSLGFVKSLPSTQSAYVTAFYENNKAIQQAYADMRHYAEIGDYDKVIQIQEEKGDQIMLEKVYDKTSKEIANVRKQIRVITNDESMDGESKKEEIDRLKELISMLAEQAESVRKSMK